MSTITAEEFRTIALDYSHEGAVARVTLRGGRGNIVTGEMMRELRAAFASAAGEPGTKIVVLAAEGRHFSFGASVEEHTRENATGMIREFHGLILDMARLDVPILTCVAGACLGGALELALAGSLIFADAGATFGQPEIVLGVFAPPASALLSMRVGYARAEELLLTGITIDAQRAAEIGLVNHLFDTPEELAAGTDVWIQEQIVPKSASSLRMALRAERLRMIDILEVTLPRLERLYLDRLMETHDANEGIQAFLEKRPPVWE